MAVLIKGKVCNCWAIGSTGSSVPELTLVSIALIDQEYYSPWMGCWSITGYLPSFGWYPFTPWWREAIEVKQLAQGCK